MPRPAAQLRWLALGCVLSLTLLSPGAVKAQETDPLTVALTGKYPPFSFYDAEGDLTGFDVQVAQALGEAMGREVEIITTEWDGIVAGLLVGKYDTVVGSMAITPERAERVDFSDPYYISGAQLFVRAEDAVEIQSLDDLAGRRVGVGLGETYEHWLRSNHPEIEAVAYKAAVDFFHDMLNHRIDAFLTDRLVGLYQIDSADMPFVPTGPLLYEERIAIPVRPDNQPLLAEINQGLATLRADGTLADLNEAWFGEAARATPGSAGEQARMTAATATSKLLRGFGVTLFVAVIALGLGMLLAVPVGAVLHRRGTLLYYPLRWFVDFIRATPLLIQLFFVYFGGPQVGLTLSPLQAAVLTLTVSATCYLAEVVRSGLLAVPDGQKLAAEALGLKRLQVFRFVVWPQAFRVALPALMNSVVALIKDTALISVIAVAEVIREAQSIISVTYDPMRYYFVAAALFFIVTFPLMKLADRLERKIAARGYAA